MGIINLLDTLKLTNGLKVSISDYTKVYFGDYHHVRVQIHCSLDESSHKFKQLLSDSINPGDISYTRTLERMGVPSSEIESVITALLKDFELNSLPYLSSPEFPNKMIEKQFYKKVTPVRRYLEATS